MAIASEEIGRTSFPPRFWRILIVTSVVSALIGTVIGALITEPVKSGARQAIHAIQESVDEDPPPPTAEEKMVAQYVRETTTADIWKKRPVLWRESAAYFKQHFAQLDPRIPHRFRDNGHWVVLPNLVAGGGLWSGAEVITYGEVVVSNLLRLIPDSPGGPTLQWVIQLRSPEVKGPMVYCRVPLRAGRFVQGGEKLFVRGIALAAGHIELTKGGFAHVTYMACSAIARPRGKYGKGEVPPLPGYPDMRSKPTPA